ncbi:MAG TPA: alanine racemase [Pirellulaceae bacterium]|nr:alanine racemase [Pirellulaceae bacterium]
MDFVENFGHKRQLIEQILNTPPAGRPGDFTHVVDRILQRRDDLLALCQQHATPLFAYDPRSFREALDEFTAAFGRHVPRHRPFFAVKSNHYPELAADAMAGRFGLDVSSSRELRLALAAGAGQILFSGPGKSAADLELASANRERVIVNLDSFRELALLGEVAAHNNSGRGLRVSAGGLRGGPMRAGVRIHTAAHGSWSKFGIPLADLPRFWRAAAGLPGIDLQGIQSHLSWTHDASPYCRVIEEVARTLASEFTPAERAQVRFYDFGGGFRPFQLEGRYPTELPLGELIRVADDVAGEASRFAAPYYFQESVPLELYAREIGVALIRHLSPLLDCDFFSEPGRVVAAHAMHLVMRVADQKRDDLVIVDGGIHMIGWERYLHVYCPVVNLTRPARREIPVTICGSLCDPEDLLGRHCFAESIQEGDVLVMPFQGAYTYSTAHNFIREIPPVYSLSSAASSLR